MKQISQLYKRNKLGRKEVSIWFGWSVKAVNMRLVKHREHHHCSSAFAFSHLLQQINRWGVKRQLFKWLSAKPVSVPWHSYALCCGMLNECQPSSRSSDVFVVFAMIQLDFTEHLSCVTPPGARTKSSFNGWMYSVNWQEDSHNYSERWWTETLCLTPSSAAWSCTYMDLNEPANSISKLEGTLPIWGVFVIQAWRACPPWLRDVQRDFLVWVVLMMCGE